VVEENVERADVESLRCKLCIGLAYNVSYEIIQIYMRDKIESTHVDHVGAILLIQNADLNLYKDTHYAKKI